MPVTTVSAAIHIAPVVLKTFLQHGKRRAKGINEGKPKQEAKDDIFFDEAFHIVKAFIELGTINTVESLQAFTNTHVPAPPWAVVVPVTIPLSTCNSAADTLIDWFGPNELKHVVGGERWWQVRGLDGIDAEWITEKKYLNETGDSENPVGDISDDDVNITRMEHLESVMLYVHGGGYFWGSINTHRYQIIRYARKFRGRAFAVNYRKAPQYPWPCPLQDVIAAYLYLIKPPPGARHRAISPSKIVLAGDSAGGGLCLTMLTIFRDLGLSMPAGAVLISPWVDLTHSFPSIVENADTDIIPQHGFLAKPSVLWPIEPCPTINNRVAPSRSSPPPEPGHTDTLKPSESRVKNDEYREHVVSQDKRARTQAEMLREAQKVDPVLSDKEGNRNSSSLASENGVEEDNDYDIDFWEPKPPKVLMDDCNAIPLELHSQIQLYATTEQLTHPLVSPILQGSLANLPPLYILAGNDEVLRDEVIYLAHRAAHPSGYPARHGVLRDGNRQNANAKNFTKPTKVHLQVYDGMCHVLTVFSFTDSAKRAYRSIAEFVNHVTQHDTEHDVECIPFPEILPQFTENPSKPEVAKPYTSLWGAGSSKVHGKGVHMDKTLQSSPEYHGTVISQEIQYNEAGIMSSSYLTSDSRTKGSEIQTALMIRERVDFRGIVRPMEPCDEIGALKLRPGQIGIIKEGPTRRWLEGQEEWDTRYKHAAKKVTKRRAKFEAKAERLLDNARLQGLNFVGQNERPYLPNSISTPSRNKIDRIQGDRRWGPLDLDDERPPPSAIAKRRDTSEALALLKKSIYHTAPVTHGTVPSLRILDAIRAAFDPNDDPNKPPAQSVSEQQVRTHVIPVHGLRVWDGIVRYFGRETSKKALKSTKAVGEQLGIVASDP